MTTPPASMRTSPAAATRWPGRERGAALIVALIAVVAMAAAAFALFRSVDEGHGAVAQYPLARNARLGVDLGMNEAMLAWAGTHPEAALDIVAADRDRPEAAYWAALPAQTADGLPAVLTALPAPAWTPDGPASSGWPGERVDASTQQLRRYAIERLCSSAGPPSEAGCRLHDPLPAPCAGQGCAATVATVAERVPYVRITVRVDGPRGTVAYGQAFVHGH